MKEKELTLNEYQRMAMTTCLPSCKNDMYMLLGLVEEVGELCGKVSKAIRKEQMSVDENDLSFRGPTFDEDNANKSQIKSELGDILWFVAGLSRRFNWSLESIGNDNLKKLEKRKEQGTIVTHTDH